MVYLWPDPPTSFETLAEAERWAEGHGVRLVIEAAQQNARKKAKSEKDLPRVRPLNWIEQKGVWRKGPCARGSAKSLEWAQEIASDTELTDGFPQLGDSSSEAEDYAPRVCGDARDRILQLLSEGSAMTEKRIAKDLALSTTVVRRELTHMVKDGRYPSLEKGPAGYQISSTGRIQASWERQAAAELLRGSVDEAQLELAAREHAKTAKRARRKQRVSDRGRELDQTATGYEWVTRQGRRAYTIEAWFHDPFGDERELAGRLTLLKGPGDDRTWGEHQGDYATVAEVWIHPGHSQSGAIQTILFEHASVTSEAMGYHLASLPRGYLPAEQRAFWRHQEEMRRAEPATYKGAGGFSSTRYFLDRPPPQSLANPHQGLSLEPTIGPALYHRRNPGDESMRQLQRAVAPGDVEGEARVIRERLRRTDLFTEQVWLLSVLGDPAAGMVVEPGGAEWWPSLGVNTLITRGKSLLEAGPTFGILAGVAMLQEAMRLTKGYRGLDGVGLAYAHEVVRGAWGWLANLGTKRHGGKPVRERYKGSDWNEAAYFIFDINLIPLGERRCNVEDLRLTKGRPFTPDERREEELALRLRCAAFYLAMAVAMAQVDPEASSLEANKWPSAIWNVYQRVSEIYAMQLGFSQRTGPYPPAVADRMARVILDEVKPWVLARGPAVWDGGWSAKI